jgi:hypothetical protein
VKVLQCLGEQRRSFYHFGYGNSCYTH